MNPFLRFSVCLAICFTGCEPASKTPTSTPVAQGTPSSTPGVTPTHADDPSIASNRGFASASPDIKAEASAAGPEAPNPIELTVRLEGVGIASGGHPDQWRGFKPREIFLKAQWSHQGVEQRFRIRTGTPEQGKQLLGRMVTIKGHWMHRPTTRSTTAIRASSAPAGLGYVKGQELFEVVQKQRTDRVRGALGVSDDERVNLEGWSKVSKTHKRPSLPVFVADSIRPSQAPR